MRMPMKYFLILLNLTVTSCASTSQVTNISQVTKHDPDTYHLDVTVRLFGSIRIVERNALAAAKNYCVDLGKEVLVYEVSSEKTGRSIYFARITFNCLTGDDPILNKDVYKNKGVYFIAE